MPLTANAVSAGRIEESIGKLWYEWLTGYFNGANHTIGGVVLDFPAAEVRIQGRPVSQPLTGASIAVTWVSPAAIRRCWEPASGVLQERVYARMSFSFWVRTTGRAADGTNAHYQAQLAADRLYAALSNSRETMTLAEKGMHRIRARPPQLVAKGPLAMGGDQASEYEMRLIGVTATLTYTVASQS